jgi:formylglycine-generating enzyme required for sulfatase activity
MGGGSRVGIACVLAVSGLPGVITSARGLDPAGEPPGTVAEPPRIAGEPPRPVAKPARTSTERSRTTAGPSRTAAKRAKRITNSIGMHFVLVPAGEFLMGSPASDRYAEPDERPQHKVRITRPFLLGTYEVTQQEYLRVIGANPSSEQLSPQQPVEKVSWFDAVEFCNRLSASEHLSPYCEISGETVKILGGDGYRLPTEKIDQQLAALGPSVGNATADNYHNILSQQHNTMVREQRRLSSMLNGFSQQGGDFQEQLREFSKELADMEDSYRQAVEELRASVAEINTRYEELAADEEITKALSDLSATAKMKQRLGPSRELKDANTALARAAGSNRARTPSKKGRKTNF